MRRAIRAAMILAAVAAAASGCTGDDGGSASPASSMPSTTATGAVTTVSRTFDASTVRGFPVGMTMRLPAGWEAQEGAPGTIDVVHKGDPPSDEAQWWGISIAPVDGATVHDPGTLSVTDRPPTMKDYVPWPADYVAYLAGLPGVQVDEGPEALEVGGAPGRRLVVATPPMHPLVWLAGDTGPLGGGPTGVDPAMERQIALVDVGGHTLLIEYADAPGTFKARLPDVEDVLRSIDFPASGS